PRIADRVFHRQGAPIRCFRGAWHAALEAAGFSHQEKQPDGSTRTAYTPTFHDFKRTAARNLVMRGGRGGVAMQITGHKPRSVFDRYAIVAPAETREALEKVSTR